MRARNLFCALGLTLLAAICSTTLVYARDDKPQFPITIKPTCTIEFGATTFYDGHEGLDLCGPEGTPIYSVLSGEVVHIGNWPTWGNSPWPDTVIVKSKWNGADRFLLYAHSDMSNIPVRIGQRVRQGQVLAYVGPKGSAKYWSGPHLHLGLFKANWNPIDIQNHVGKHVTDWMGIWDNPRDILGYDPDKPGKGKPIPPNEKAGWLDLIIDWIQEVIQDITDFFNGIETPKEEPKPDHSRTYKFSISEQKPGNAKYQHNIRAFFAWPTSGYSLKVMQEMDLQNFEGSWGIKPGKTSVNDIFGTAKYEQGQGMKVPPGFGIGDGACHTASMVAYVLAEEGMFVKCDDPSHESPIPGVLPEWNCTVCIPTQQYPCSGNLEKDIGIENLDSKSVILHWKIEGDLIQLWVVKETPRSSVVNTNLMLIAIGAVITIFVIWFFYFRGSDDDEQYIFGSAGKTTLLSRVIRVALEESKNWIFAILVIILLVPSILNEIRIYGFAEWYSGRSLISNWLIIIIGVLIVGNFIVNSFFRSKHRTKYIFVGKERNWGWIWLIIVALYFLSSISDKYPIYIDILVIFVCLSLAIPAKYKRGCMRYGCIFLVIIMLVPIFGAAFGIFVITQAIESIGDRLNELEVIQKVIELAELISNFLDWDLPFPRPPDKDGPYGTGELLSEKEMIDALLTSNLQKPNFENVREKYKTVVSKSKKASYDPAISMSIWIEESGASNYSRYPGVADFGCISKKRMDFDIQFTCWLELWDKYSEDTMFTECRGEDNTLSLREFLLIYEGGFKSCRAGNFIVEPGFPKRLKNYYEVVTDGGKLDF